MARRVVVWLRNDLRLHDNEPCSYAPTKDIYSGSVEGPRRCGLLTVVAAVPATTVRCHGQKINEKHVFEKNTYLQ